MRRIWLISAALIVFFSLQGCTIHFKGKDVEFDAERQRVQNNHTYELKLIELFGG